MDGERAEPAVLADRVLPSRLSADRAGRVVVSGYSSAAIGRLVPEDPIALIRLLREHVAA